MGNLSIYLFENSCTNHVLFSYFRAVYTQIAQAEAGDAGLARVFRSPSPLVDMFLP